MPQQAETGQLTSSSDVLPIWLSTHHLMTATQISSTHPALTAALCEASEQAVGHSPP
jgi:hypothetical protein